MQLRAVGFSGWQPGLLLGHPSASLFRSVSGSVDCVRDVCPDSDHLPPLHSVPFFFCRAMVGSLLSSSLPCSPLSEPGTLLKGIFAQTSLILFHLIQTAMQSPCLAHEALPSDPATSLGDFAPAVWWPPCWIHALPTSPS